MYIFLTILSVKADIRGDIRKIIFFKRLLSALADNSLSLVFFNRLFFFLKYLFLNKDNSYDNNSYCCYDSNSYNEVHSCFSKWW